ncbi:NB-ARC domain-containing protein [Streptomyces zhihengii]|uniref:NB-ARC domain-containing protein n=1 Tax=Streptomyces zhihengii TaxID=1818004 RepID=UPI0033A7C4AF
MDPAMLAATSASIVSALTTEAWPHLRDRLVQLFRASSREEVGQVSDALDEARQLMLAVQDDREARLEHELTITWHRRLQDLLQEDATADVDLRRFLVELWSSPNTGYDLAPPQSLVLLQAADLPHAMRHPLQAAGTSDARIVTSSTADLEPAGSSWYQAVEPLGAARMLPPDLPSFTGREQEVAELQVVASMHEEVPLCLLHGMPGVGKTALAVHAAHSLADRFPDGQLFINLRGHDVADEPASAHQLLESLLLAAGIPRGVQPRSVHGRAGLWRSWLSSRRVLLVLDDAADFAQVEPLLPGYPGCSTIVTSRVRMEAPQVTRSLLVDVLPPYASLELFNRILQNRGLRRVSAPNESIAQVCGNLPLALSVAAGLLLTHPTWTAADLVAELAPGARQLARLGSGRRSVSQALGLSVNRLAPQELSFLRALSLHPGRELEKRAASVLADVSVDDADDYLERLYHRSLLTEVSPGRFQMHDLLLSYLETGAGDLDDEQEPARAAGPSRHRLVDYYRSTATTAYLVESDAQAAALQDPPAPSAAPIFSSPEQATEWFALELDNLAACTQYEADHPDAVVEIATILTAHLLRVGGHGVSTADQIIASGLQRAISRQDQRTEALFTHLSGIVCVARRDLSQAVTRLRRAEQLSEGDNWQLGRARALFALYICYRLSGTVEDASEALRIAREIYWHLRDEQGLDRAAQQRLSLDQEDLSEAPQALGRELMTGHAAGSQDNLAQLENLAVDIYLSGVRGAAEPPQGAESATGALPAHPDLDPGQPQAPPQTGNSGSGSNIPPHPPVYAEPPDDEPEDADRDAHDALSAATRMEDLQAIDEQKVNFWFADELPDDGTLQVDTTYTGCFQVGPDHDENIIAGDRVIRSEDIPAGGLLTEWFVFSTTSRLALSAAGEEDPEAVPSIAGDLPQSAVQFQLQIFPRVPSDQRLLTVTPVRSGPCRIDVLIMVAGDIYRELTIDFDADEPPAPTLEPVGGVTPSQQTVPVPGPRDEAESACAPEHPTAEPLVGELSPRAPRQRGGNRPQVSDNLSLSSSQTALRSPLFWQRPSRTLTLNLTPSIAIYQLHLDSGVRIRYDTVPWEPRTDAAQYAHDAQVALEAYRQHHASRYNTITPADIAQRLERFSPTEDWSQSITHASAKDIHAWEEAASSQEIRELAFAGKELLDALFPHNHVCHQLIRELAPGDKLNVHWHRSEPDHVPWPLIFCEDLPRAGHPINAQDFLGLRLRSTHLSGSGKRERILPADAARAYLMYWGDSIGDETFPLSVEHTKELDELHERARESELKYLDRFDDWKPLFLPLGHNERKAELSAYLCDPEPVSLIYLYSQAYADAGRIKGLRFGSTDNACDVLRLSEMGSKALQDQPLVFANACETSSAEYLYTNDLKNHFFKRESRAYIGTECKVPAGFAGRFAHVFFHFLYMRFHPEQPTSAGEALTQTRRFFWNEYRSIGGLFYSYINDDHLYVARPGEIEAMHKPPTAAIQTGAR